MSRVENATLINGRGESVAIDELIHWHPPEGDWRPFLSTKLTWTVDGMHKGLPLEKKLYVKVLPDASGLICFEGGFRDDNCYVLDAYGEFRYRLTVPCELTKYEVPMEAKRWFRGLGSCLGGQYGVFAWIECAGDFYFELDYHTGRFLWGKEIRF